LRPLSGESAGSISVAVPVADIDRAKEFYAEMVGFNADHDHPVSEEVRFV